MQISKKVLSMILAFVMVLGLLPATAFATAAEEDVVYLSVSFDADYIKDKNGTPMVHVPISLADIAAVDLTEYGLENMLFDSNGDGKYETTALQLMIYAHEKLYGGSWNDVTFDAIPGSSYFKGGIFGFTENLVYFLNGDFPIYEETADESTTVGATSDRIVLKAGDFLDVASFSCYSFLWDEAGGFHLFADQSGNYVHDYTATSGKALSVKLKHSFCDLMFGKAWVKDATDHEVFYGTTYGVPQNSFFTDSNGCAEITFPTAGTYYVWCKGGHSEDSETHSSCDYCVETGKPCIVSAPAFAKVTVTEETSSERQPQSVRTVLNATMAQMAATVTEPAFGTNAGEWTVFSLARGNYFAKDSQYFANYYDRIVEYVNTTAAAVGKDGALDRTKSTDNSRLIMALAAIGKDATSVGNWDLVDAYSANGFNWIRKQGMNGTIWTLIALDCGNYETSDPSIRQQCVDSLLSLQHNDGGWSLVTAKAQPSNVDITGMTLTALYPYRDQPEVAAACETAFDWLSESQLDNGGFPYGLGETSESCVWAIVAATTWGINPDTDPRFIKNGNSAIANLLTYYREDMAMFEHIRGSDNGMYMATDQAAYGLIAYDRLINDKTALYDYSDLNESPAAPSGEEMAATLGLPANINPGEAFNGVISINKWDNAAGYKLIDLIVTVPEGVAVTEVCAGSRLAGGEVAWNLEAETGKLRVVYFDANENTDLTVTGEEFPAELFTVKFKAENVTGGSNLDIAISGMSVKRTSDSADENAMAVVDTTTARDTVNVVAGISFSAKCLYTGDDVDMIPSTRKAVTVAVTGITGGSKLTFTNGDAEIVFKYSKEISEKIGEGVCAYVALVDAAIEMEKFVDEKNFTIGAASEDKIAFGDINGDGVINAQDALAAVDTWLRKGDAPTDDQILELNVNGDSRINTFDALGIVEKFVDGSEFSVVTKAATITEDP